MENPGAMRAYNANRVEKDPTVWSQKQRRDRKAILGLLGGKCVVCGVDNPNWLHVDYIPTTRNEKYRHPRSVKWITDHQDLFRILCANHHYELTLTGKIEGTELTQPTGRPTSDLPQNGGKP